MLRVDLQCRQSRDSGKRGDGRKSSELGLTPRDPAVAAATAAVLGSERVRRLLSERVADGTLPFHPYNAKWRGAHWVLVALAELGYPAGDESLAPLCE
ncbi:hypothetical protein ACIO14_18795 [Nocardia fluminea]|uniref:hypothetical protein n=1 Tax=Nocardia fluminea TaxID=134984 RepID=UPI00382272AB